MSKDNKEFKGTKGDWIHTFLDSANVEIRNSSDLSKPIAVLSSYYMHNFVFSYEELEANAELIAEAGNLAQKYGSLKELERQRNELESWKKEQIAISSEFFDFMHSRKGGKFGQSIHMWAIDLIKERDELKAIQNPKE